MQSLVERAHALRLAAHALSEDAASQAASSSSSSNAWLARTALQTEIIHAFDEAESFIELLARQQVPDLQTCASLMMSSMDATSAMLHRITDLEQRLVNLAIEVAGLKDREKRMLSQLDNLQMDADALLFRELATQTVSKLARKATGCTAWEARQTPLGLIKRGQGAPVYQSTLLQYPLLKDAVEAACSQGKPIAHPIPAPPVTEQALRTLIQRSVATPVRPAAEQLLDCLVQLARDLQEPLFVTAVPPG